MRVLLFLLLLVVGKRYRGKLLYKVETKPEDAILKSLFTYPYIISKQITSLLYSQGSYRTVLKFLKKLTINEYLLRKPLPSQVLRGSVPYVYWLSAPGRRYLESLGYDFSGWLFPSEMKLPQSSHLWHALAVNDVLIAGSKLSDGNPDVKLMDCRHDLYMQMTMNLAVKPDGWQLFYIKETEKAGVWLELDRGTELEKIWKAKIEKIVTYVLGGFQDDFGTRAVTVAVVVPSNIMGAAQRVRKLKQWTEHQLTKMGKEQEYDLFRFLLLPETFTADWLYLAPVWLRPFDEREHSLFLM